MLGVIHRAPEGPALLDQWLDAVSPAVVTLEFSNYGRRFREERGPAYRQRIEEVHNRLKRDNLPCYDNAVSMALSYVEMPFELAGALQYGRIHGAPVYLIDMDFFSYLRLREIGKLLDPENLERLLCEETSERNGYEHILARLYFEEGINTAAYTEEMAVRDEYMSHKIKVLMVRHRGQRLLHITGWRHLDDPRNFFAPLNPVKVFIYDQAVRI